MRVNGFGFSISTLEILKVSVPLFYISPISIKFNNLLNLTVFFSIGFTVNTTIYLVWRGIVLVAFLFFDLQKLTRQHWSNSNQVWSNKFLLRGMKDPSKESKLRIWKLWRGSGSANWTKSSQSPINIFHIWLLLISYISLV